MDGEDDVGESGGGVGMGDIMNDDETNEERKCCGGNVGVDDAVEVSSEWSVAQIDTVAGGVERRDIVSDDIEEERE